MPGKGQHAGMGQEGEKVSQPSTLSKYVRNGKLEGTA